MLDAPATHCTSLGVDTKYFFMKTLAEDQNPLLTISSISTPRTHASEYDFLTSGALGIASGTNVVNAPNSQNDNDPAFNGAKNTECKNILEASMCSLVSSKILF